ncbi:MULTISPECIES: hypothetical protein [Methylomonas]|uniref:hypothetical protein n=1 Tax=Methylomonas TaxID=416 RepID=UPI000A68CC0A|nr:MULTISPECIES: hypothetical protein [Methylomonas]
MNPQDILKTFVTELKRCGISLIFIAIGVFLATANAPAASATTPAKSQYIPVQSLRPIVVLQPLLPTK